MSSRVRQFLISIVSPSSVEIFLDHALTACTMQQLEKQPFSIQNLNKLTKYTLAKQGIA